MTMYGVMCKRFLINVLLIYYYPDYIILVMTTGTSNMKGLHLISDD